jgi:pyruvate/2-oxoglutarate dehydrogenase complex dihydrolipoamide dehydrogenase (E3) component
MTKQIAVIGAGPAGVAAAGAAAECGAQVTLVGAEPAGGRAGWHSLLPSKVLLTAADTVGTITRLQTLGLSNAATRPQISALIQRIQTVSRRYSDSCMRNLAQRGVRFLAGTASFTSPHHLKIMRPDSVPASLEADAIIIASGSVPTFPPGLKPDGQRIIAPRFVGKLDHLPASIVVVSGGVTGTEFVYAFNRLGVSVTWIVDEIGVLPSFAREPVELLVEALAARGVARHEGVAAGSAVAGEDGVIVTLQDGRSFQAEMAFIAVGRVPDLGGLNLLAAGLQADSRTGIAVGGYGQSEIPSVFAAGDVTGLPMTANKAMAQGWIAGRRAAGAAVDAYRPETVVEAVYTDPQVAQVGLSATRARENGRPIQLLQIGYDSSLKAALLDEEEGLVQLVADARDGTLLGATATGTHAADVLAPVALGLRLGARIDDLAAVFAAHPGVGEVVFAAARTAGADL